MADSFLVMGVRAFHRVPQQDNEPYVRKLAGQALRRERMEQIVRACFARDRRNCQGPGDLAAADRQREVRTVPARAPGELGVVVMGALDALAPGKQRCDRRMLEQIVVQRRRPAAFGADDDEARPWPQAGGHLAVTAERALDAVARTAVRRLDARSEEH